MSPTLRWAGISLYDVLGASPSATADELRQAYLRQARHLHPDQAGDLAAMQELNAAWEVLGDPAARAVYDQQQATERRPPDPGPPRPGSDAWYEEDARVEAELRRRREQGIDLPSAVLRSET